MGWLQSTSYNDLTPELSSVVDCDGIPTETLALRTQVGAGDCYSKNDDLNNCGMEWIFLSALD